jgi:hypothetical protein
MGREAWTARVAAATWTPGVIAQVTLKEPVRTTETTPGAGVTKVAAGVAAPAGPK